MISYITKRDRQTYLANYLGGLPAIRFFIKQCSTTHSLYSTLTEVAFSSTSIDIGTRITTEQKMFLIPILFADYIT